MIIIFPLLVLLIGLLLHLLNGVTKQAFQSLGIPTYFAGLLFICYIYAPRIIDLLKVQH